MGFGFGSWILSFGCLALVHAAELIRVPLVERDASQLRKRDLGYSPLISDVVPGAPNVDLAYLGEVSIGTPPQSFLVSMLPFTYFELMGSYRYGIRSTMGHGYRLSRLQCVQCDTV